MRFRASTLTVLLLALSSPALAGGDDAPTREELREQRRAEKQRKRQVAQFARGKHRVEGADLSQNVERVNEELTWHDELEEARQAAVVANKPILWVQALGDLSGLL